MYLDIAYSTEYVHVPTYNIGHGLGKWEVLGSGRRYLQVQAVHDPWH